MCYLYYVFILFTSLHHIIVSCYCIHSIHFIQSLHRIILLYHVILSCYCITLLHHSLYHSIASCYFIMLLYSFYSLYSITSSYHIIVSFYFTLLHHVIVSHHAGSRTQYTNIHKYTNIIYNIHRLKNADPHSHTKSAASRDEDELEGIEYLAR
jgi:hypothetical protein